MQRHGLHRLLAIQVPRPQLGGSISHRLLPQRLIELATEATWLRQPGLLEPIVDVVLLSNRIEDEVHSVDAVGQVQTITGHRALSALE